MVVMKMIYDPPSKPGMQLDFFLRTFIPIHVLETSAEEAFGNFLHTGSTSQLTTPISASTSSEGAKTRHRQACFYRGRSIKKPLSA